MMGVEVKGQRSQESILSPSTMWIPGVNLMSSGFTASAFTYWTIWPARFSFWDMVWCSPGSSGTSYIAKKDTGVLYPPVALNLGLQVRHYKRCSGECWQSTGLDGQWSTGEWNASLLSIWHSSRDSWLLKTWPEKDLGWCETVEGGSDWGKEFLLGCALGPLSDILLFLLHSASCLAWWWKSLPAYHFSSPSLITNGNVRSWWE